MYIVRIFYFLSESSWCYISEALYDAFRSVAEIHMNEKNMPLAQASILLEKWNLFVVGTMLANYLSHLCWLEAESVWASAVWRDTDYQEN